MWNKPSKTRLSKLPKLYATEKTKLEDTIIHLHFFIGGCDWYAAEFDGRDRFFGYTILNGDFMNAEWGYFSLAELESVGVPLKINGRKLRGRLVEVDCEKDYCFPPRPAIKILKIREGMGWPDPNKTPADIAAEREFDAIMDEPMDSPAPEEMESLVPEKVESEAINRFACLQ